MIELQEITLAFAGIFSFSNFTMFCKADEAVLLFKAPNWYLTMLFKGRCTGELCSLKHQPYSLLFGSKCYQVFRIVFQVVEMIKLRFFEALFLK